MSKRSNRTMEALFEHYMLNSKPSEEPVLPFFVMIMPIASAASLAATIAYILIK